MAVSIGERIRRLRQKNDLTQRELADRCELSKGFISQLESDQTSPSLSTLDDILTVLGSSFAEFFRDDEEGEPVCKREDVFVKDNGNGTIIHWLIPDAQRKTLEPILLHVAPGADTEKILPHNGEEFGYVLSGTIMLILGDRVFRVRKGDSFSYKATSPHFLRNAGKVPADVLWVITPPNY